MRLSLSSERAKECKRDRGWDGQPCYDIDSAVDRESLDLAHHVDFTIEASLAHSRIESPPIHFAEITKYLDQSLTMDAASGLKIGVQVLEQSQLHTRFLPR